MKHLVFISCLLAFGCANGPLENTREVSSEKGVVIHTPKDLGYIHIGSTGYTRWPMNNPNYIFEQDLTEEKIESDDYPIGEYVLKPGSIVNLKKSVTFYTKPSFWEGGKNNSGAFKIEAGTKVRILSYDREGMTGKTNAIVEIVP